MDALKIEALRKLDVTYARKMFPNAISDEALLVALHKARYETVSIEPELRHASGAWLRKRGFGRVGGLPLLPTGKLP
jgi:hypothetical protein